MKLYSGNKTKSGVFYQPIIFLEGEEHFEQDKPWKKKRTFSHSNDDEESKNFSTHKKAKRSRRDPQFSGDSTNFLIQDSSCDLSSEDEEIQDDQDINNEDYNHDGV
jgi:hypothetical protein